MFKSIFSRQLIVCVGILLMSFLLLGTALTQVFTSHFIRRQELMLTQKGEQISDLFETVYLSSSLSEIIAVNRLSNEIRVLYEYLDSSVFVVDKNHVVTVTSPDIAHIHNKQIDINKVPEVQQVIMGNQITTQGFLSGIYQESKLTIGYPLTVQGQTVGAIFMSTSMPELQQSILDVILITAVYTILLCIIAFLLIYFTSRNISRPIKEINEAAKVIANGNFDKRIVFNSKDEVGQLAQSFNNMAESLEKQENTRREFIANISHDIRSPLTSIKGFLEAIIDGTIPKEKHDRYLKIILDECIRLNKLANNLLYVSNIHYLGKERLELKAFDINILIKETVIKFDNVIENKNIELILLLTSNNSIVLADYVKIQRVVYNLLDNAIKFTNEGGSIEIKTIDKNSKLYVSIKDTGVGISLEDQDKIFDRFYKVDSSRGKDKVGSGLGLSIVKEFIKAHNQEITINSNEGDGCEFVFTLNLNNNKKVI